MSISPRLTKTGNVLILLTLISHILSLLYQGAKHWLRK